MKNVDTLVLGATVFGTIYAIQNDACIIDNHINLGYEFTDSLKANPCIACHTYSEETLDFYADLKKRNIISEQGYLHLYPVSGMLAKKLVDANVTVDITCDILAVEKSKHGYEVQVCSRDGYDTITAQKIIDTRITAQCLNRIQQYDKYISAYLINGRGLPNDVDACVCIVSGRFEDECYLKFKADKRDDIGMARRKLFAFWKENYKKFNGFQIASVASEFDYEVPQSAKITMFKGEDGIYSIPSGMYQNLLLSYEEGVKCCFDF